MANFKIINTSPKYPDILLYRDRDEDGGEIVEIKTIGIIDGEDDMFACETVNFQSSLLACSFINDFSKKSADDWCESENIKL